MKNMVVLDNYHLFKTVKNENIRMFLFDNFLSVGDLKLIKNNNKTLIITDGESRCMFEDISTSHVISVLIKNLSDGFCSRYYLREDFNRDYVWVTK